jgi:iron complex outermembrane recepter protein
MRLSLVATAVSLSLVALAVAEDARAAVRKRTDIPAQQLERALEALAKDHAFQVIYRSEIVGRRMTGGASGDLTAREALAQLLEQTGLTYRYLDDHTVTILPLASSGSGATAQANGASSAESVGHPQEIPDESLKREEVVKAPGSFWQRFRLAQSDSTRNNVSATGTGSTADESGSLRQVEEVVVTAQKRIERLSEVPVPVTAITADTLVGSNQLRFQDYYSKIPGVSFSSGFRGESFIAIRGVTTGGLTHPTVGITVDDVPYGSSTLLGGGYSAPDFNPSDLARIEVLRGPQGTLYGANSMGGLIKFVTVDPSVETLNGKLQIGSTGVRNGDGLGYSVRGAVNVPLGDTFAVRASGFNVHDAGYIDDALHGIEGINESDSSGGLLASMWRPSESLSLKLTALVQNIDTEGSNLVYVQPALGDLQQAFIRSAGEFNRNIQAYGATLRADLGPTELTSITGYGINEFTAINDRSQSRGALANQLFGVTGAVLTDDNQAKRFTQEVRLAFPLGKRVEWLIGGFYTDESTRWQQNTLAADPATGLPVGALLLNRFPTSYEERALFTNITFSITDRFDIQLGARGIDNEQSYSAVTSGPLAGGGAITPKLTSEEDAFTYLVTPRFRISPDLMVYARLASGYRPGGVNPGAETFGLQRDFDKDETENYELGVKAVVLSRMLSLDASVYYIDWQDIQLSVLDPVSRLSYTTNASRAKSRGVELSAEAKPVEGMTIAAWTAWNDAELTEAFPPTSLSFGRAGDRLPYTSRFSGHLSFDQAFSLSSDVTGFLGGSFSYIGDRQSVFTGSALRQEFPSYTQLDVRAGLELGPWAASLFANNVTDKRGILSGGLGTAYPFAFSYIQPRTLGLSVTRTF